MLFFLGYYIAVYYHFSLWRGERRAGLDRITLYVGENKAGNSELGRINDDRTEQELNG